MRFKNLTFAVASILGCLQSSVVMADSQTDVSYPFESSYPLAFGAASVSDDAQGEDFQTFLFVPYLMVVDGNNPVALSSLFDRTHTLVDQRFKNLFLQIDDLFSDGQPVEGSNLSWARLRLDSVSSREDGHEIKAAIKLRVVLPRAEKRFRLLFDTDEDETTVATSSQGRRPGEVEGDGFSLALRFIRQARDKGTIKFDVGARNRDSKVQIFGRVNLFYAHDLRWNFHSRFSNSLYYYSSSGYENKFRYDLTRPIEGFDSLQFRGSTELAWREGRSGILVSETVGLYSEIDDNRTIAIEGLGYYTTALNDDQTDKLLSTELRVRFRHNFLRRWFFYELWPSVRWHPDNNYEPSFGGIFRVEVLVGRY